jgi:hypothetical protein
MSKSTEWSSPLEWARSASSIAGYLCNTCEHHKDGVCHRVLRGSSVNINTDWGVEGDPLSPYREKTRNTCSGYKRCVPHHDSDRYTVVGGVATVRESAMQCMCRTVNLLAMSGWKPIGGVSFCDGNPQQAMWREKYKP